MKTILIAIVCVTVASMSAFAGVCGGGCGDKEKGKEKEGTKETAAVRVIEA